MIDQVKEVLLSDLSSDAVRLWVWMLMNGSADIDKILQLPLPHVAPSLNVLIEQGRIEANGMELSAVVAVDAPKKTKPSRGRLIKVTGRERLAEALAHPRSTGARASIDEGIARIFRAYNDERKAQGIPPTNMWKGQRKVWVKVLKFIVGESVDAKAYMAFAYQETRWQKLKFPQPVMLAGDFLQSRWRDRDEGDDSHAGHAYKDAGDLKPRLITAGFGGAADLDDAMIRHIQKLAGTARKSPGLRRPHRDENIEAMILWLAGADE